MKRSRLEWSVILLLCVALAFLLPRCGKEKTGIKLAPDFTLKTLEGAELTLSQMKGKVVLLDFWATWCGPCREAIPHLVQLYKSYHDKGFELMGMSMDKGDPQVVRRFVKSMDIPYPILMAPEEMARNFGVTALPTTILIDKEGKVRDKIIGFNSTISKQLASQVARLTSEP